MNRIIFLFLISILTFECSLNKNSKFWSKTKTIDEDTKLSKKKIVFKESTIADELNPNLTIKFSTKPLEKNLNIKNYNNYGRVNFDKILKKSSRFGFAKIKNFYQFEPVISSYKDNIIFFDNKGTILNFNNQSNLVWKKNYYSKAEKKLKPILQFSNNEKYLIAADNITKYYMLDLKTGNLIWSKRNLAPFNSQIKMFEDKFFIIDFSNTLRCFSIKNGEELWNVKTEDSLIKSQKKLSMVISNNQLIFNNSVGDISAVDLDNGDLLWQLPTQSSSIYESSFSLETSEIITDGNVIYLSNNKNQLFAINIETASFNWENKVNSNLRSTLVEKYLFSISLEGFLFVTDVNSGNIIRITDIFKNLKPKKRSKVKPTGFILGLYKIYVSTNNGKIIVVDTATGKIDTILKIDNEKISQPFIVNENLFVIKDNAIIKLN